MFTLDPDDAIQVAWHPHRDRAIQLVAGPESANYAGSQISFIPMLTLAIPSHAVMALMIGAMTFNGMQPSLIKAIGRVMPMLADRGMNGEKVAILLVEQYYDFARELADDYVVMERGAVLASGAGARMEEDGVRELVAI